MYVHCSTSQSVELLVWYQDTKVWSVINVQCTSQIRREPNHTLSMRRSQSVCIFQIIQQLVLLYANISDQQKSSTNAGGETRITFTFVICAQWRWGKTISPQIMLSKPEAWGMRSRFCLWHCLTSYIIVHTADDIVVNTNRWSSALIFNIWAIHNSPRNCQTGLQSFSPQLSRQASCIQWSAVVAWVEVKLAVQKAVLGFKNCRDLQTSIHWIRSIYTIVARDRTL